MSGLANEKMALMRALVDEKSAEIDDLRRLLRAFVDAYEHQDADNFNDDLRMAYALAEVTLSALPPSERTTVENTGGGQ